MTNWPSSRLRPGARNSIRFNTGGSALGSPGGTTDNSPAFQRRERDPEISSPEGTADSGSRKSGKKLIRRWFKKQQRLTPPPAIKVNQA